DLMGKAPGQVGAVMPVMPFGQPVDMPAWQAFQEETGIPVVIDAAAGFDRLEPSGVPGVVSLHAAKLLGVGEGGFVISKSSELIDSIRHRVNHGFGGTREAKVEAVNARLSEYSAAI